MAPPGRASGSARCWPSGDDISEAWPPAHRALRRQFAACEHDPGPKQRPAHPDLQQQHPSSMHIYMHGKDFALVVACKKRSVEPGLRERMLVKTALVPRTGAPPEHLCAASSGGRPGGCCSEDPSVCAAARTDSRPPPSTSPAAACVEGTAAEIVACSPSSRASALLGVLSPPAHCKLVRHA